MADDSDGDVAELLKLRVGQGLRGSNDNTLTGMDTERVEVLHIADRDTVVILITHHFVLDLFPPLETLLHQYLWGKGESALTESI